MNDCTRTATLLEVYADAEASAETNALVQEHLEHCERCARELAHDGGDAGRAPRAALGAERASDALRGRIVAAVRHEPRQTIAGALRVLAGAGSRGRPRAGVVDSVEPRRSTDSPRLPSRST